LASLVGILQTCG